MTKKTKGKAISGLLLTIGLLSFAGVYVSVKIFGSATGLLGGLLVLFFFLLLGVGILATVAGIAFFIMEYRLAWENRTISALQTPLWLAKVGSLVLGIVAAIFTIEFILVEIEFCRQYGYHINYWEVILQWPQTYYIFLPPFDLPFMMYIRLLIACISPFLALITTRKLGYPPIYHAFWFVLALLFPFSLLILALMPRYSTEIRKRHAAATYAFLAGIVWGSIGLFMLSQSSGSGDVVYVVGARWIGTDNPVVWMLLMGVGFLFAGMGFVGIISAILVTLGIIKPETVERMLQKFGFR